jgi:elongation factor G
LFYTGVLFGLFIYIFALDRAGANPSKIVGQLRQKLKLHAAPVQIPIGSEDNFKGVIDLVKMKAYYHEGAKG